MSEKLTLSAETDRRPNELTTFDKAEMAELLSHHYGDGIVYLSKNNPHHPPLYATALKLAYVSEEGYLTRKGRVFLADQNCI